MSAESMGDPMTFPPSVRSHGPHTATDSTREGSSTGTLRHGEVPPIISGTTPYSGSGYVSPSPHRDGRPLIPSNPPSRPGSAKGGSHRQHDPPRTQLTTPPSLTSESSVTPNIRFDRLEGVLPTEQLSELRRLISHHGLQRRQLVSAGSALNELRAEAHNVRTSAESLTGRVDRVLSDTIQVVQDGDVVISSIGRAFDDAPEQHVGTDNIGPSGSTPDHNSSEIPAPDIGLSDHSHNTAPRGADRLSDDRTPRSEPDYRRASQRILSEMRREFPPRRADEDEIQYWNRYQAHRRLINNTQRSWDKSGHEAPPHIPNTDYRNTNAQVPDDDIRQGQAYNELNTTQTQPTQNRTHVQFDSASRPYDVGQDVRSDHGSDFANQPGFSAFKISQGPPNHGIWNSEHYHYAVMLKRIQRLIIWKVGQHMVAPPGSKQPKMSEPSKYSGNRNHEVFLQWLNQFLNWLRSHYYCGDEADVSRLNLLGNYVDGIAADWYAADIDNPERISAEPMSFIDAICAMHRRFVRTATANNAVTQYDRIEYNPTDGVEGFYYKLDKMASRMVERPSNYSFKLRLFEGLPSWIYDILLERNILPEFCNLEDIRENARQIEEMRLRARGPTRTNGITNAISTRPNSNKQNGNRTSNKDSTSRRVLPITSRENRQNDNNNRSSGPKPPMVSSTGKAYNPRTTNNYSNRNASNNKASGSGPSNVPKNTEVECYNCGLKGHIASDPKCPKYHLRQQRPRFNAQRLIDGDDQDAEERENDEIHLEVASEHGNSWGGSQYEPDDESDEHEFVQQDEEEPEEEQNASEEEPDVRIATMRALRMHAMRKITEPRPEITEPNIADIEDIIPNTREPSSANEGSSNIGTNHIGLSVEQPDDSRPSPTSEREDHNTRHFRNELPVVHSYLYESESEISDPVFIEYRDGFIFREEPGQDMDRFIEAARRNNCRLCNNCQPLVRIHRFAGSDGEQYYYYCIYTCRTPVERDRATEEISDDEDLNVERFFSARIIRSPSLSSSLNEEMVTADDLSRQQESGDDNRPESPTDIPALVEVVIESESAGYIDDPPERSNWTFTTTAGSLWDVPVDTEINPSDLTCDVCHECNPRIVAVYRNTDGGTRFIRFQQVCRNTATRHNAEAVADSSEPDHVSDPPSDTEERDSEGADELPELIPITDDKEITSEQEHVAENVRDESSSSNIDEDDDTHSDEILECPYCHNCEPRTEPAYYFCSDGEVVYRDRLICQADEDNESPAGSSLHAMRMVYSSNVRRKTATNSDQPIRSSKLQATLAAEIEINGTKALTLFDSGSTTDSITPEFAFATKAPQVKLDEQVVLQLGCVGSRSKISYGTKVPINFGGIKDETYFDLVNIDRYDCIIGTPFMNTHGVCLDFGTRSIRMNGVEIKAFTFDEEQAYVNSKRPVRGGRRPPPRETAPIKKNRADPSTST
jgi:hypothetical protein